GRPPICLKSMPSWQIVAGPAFCWLRVWREGMGNSPPATKFALSPDIAVSVGSAKVRITPACSIAFKVALKKFCPELTLKVARVALSGEPVAENGVSVMGKNVP